MLRTWWQEALSIEFSIQYCKVISLQLIKINEKKKKNLKQREVVGMDVRSIREVNAVRLENKTYGYSRRFKPEHWRGCWCYEGRVLRWGVTSCHCGVIVPCLFTQINGPKSACLSSRACCLQGLHEESTFSVKSQAPLVRQLRPPWV